MNVVLNAMEAMPQGGTLKVSTIVDEDRVGIKVVDTGVGISAEDLAHLFEPFFTKKTRGTGLGLANVKRILEEHGGSVEIESTLGEGTDSVVDVVAGWQSVGCQRNSVRKFASVSKVADHFTRGNTQAKTL